MDTPWGTTYLEMSSVRIVQGRFQEAFAALRKARELGCKERPVLENTAIAQFLSGDVAAAYETLRIADSRGMSLNPALRNKILGAMGAKK
jgi:Flp pilus assembly protein TadD